MPTPNSHIAIVRPKSDFDSSTFKSQTLPKGKGPGPEDVVGKGGVVLTTGRLKEDDGTTHAHSYQFPAQLYTPAQAKAWLRHYGKEYQTFEADGKSEASATVPLSCEIKPGERLICESVPVEWLEAAAGDDAPKKVSIVAYTGGAMSVAAYYSPVVIDLAGLTAGGEQIPLLAGHDTTQIVGHGAVSLSAQRIKVDGVISGAGQAAQEVIASAKNGFPWKASVGVIPAKTEFVERGATAKANGRSFAGPVNIVRGGVLEEISFVPIAADRRTSVEVAAHSNPEGPSMDPKFTEWLTAKGFDAEALSDEQSTLLKASYDAEQKTEPKKTPPPIPDIKGAGTDGASVDLGLDLVAYRKTIALEREKIAVIEAKCREYHDRIDGDKLAAIEAEAIRDNWHPDTLEVKLIRAARPVGPAIHGSHAPENMGQVIEAAACRTLGLKDVEKEFDEKVLEAADKRFRRDLGLKELLLMAARANGYAGSRFSNGSLREILAYALPAVRAAAAQTAFSLSGILSNVANKMILDSFNAVEDSWRKISAIGTVSDFKTHTRYRLTGDATYEKLAPDGQIRHGTLDEQSYTISADTYAKIYGFDRRDIINDDLGALDGVRRRLGRGGGLKINNVFWTGFLDNSTFFTTARANLLEGTANALTAADPIAALDAAVALFDTQTDPDGDPIAVAPAILLFPPGLAGSALDLMRSTQIVTGGGSSKTRQPSTNRYAGMFEPVKSTYLSNTSYTGYSTTAWYLLANPADLAVIEMVFLNGQQSPTIESADADFDTLGIKLRGYHDFGVSKMEYRGGIKATGVAE